MKKIMFGMALAAVMTFAFGTYAEEAKADAKDAKKDSKVEKMMKKADADSDGKVTVVEYVTFYKLDEAAGTAADKNASGIIEVDEFVIIPSAKAPKGDKPAKKEKKAEKAE